MNSTTRKNCRTKVFLGIIFVLYLWDIAFFLGIRDPAQVPHPFAAFRSLGDVVFLRGFGSMLRELIFTFVSGGLFGVAVGRALLYSPWLSGAALRFLRIALWVPFIIAYVAFAPLFWGAVTAMLAAAYHYLGARSILKIGPSDAWSWAAREALLQTLLFSLISQMWVDQWRIFDFSSPHRFGIGWAKFTLLAALIALINWSTRSSFAVTASNHALLQTADIKGLRDPSKYKIQNLGRESRSRLIALTIILLIAWLLFYTLDFPPRGTSPRVVLITAYSLLATREILADIGFSLLEIFGGITLASLLAFLSLKISAKTSLLFSLLSLTHISALFLWSIVFGLGISGFFWHKVILVGCLTFFPCLQSLWISREHPFIYRILTMTGATLPMAFVGMAFGEAMASTEGLGFLMVVANATREADKAFAVFLITLVLLVGLLSCLRFTARNLYPSLPVRENAMARSSQRDENLS